MKIGVVGAGRISSSVHLPLLSCIDTVNIEFIADRKYPKVLGNTYNTKPVKIDKISSLPDCDIVLLALPVGVKEEYIREFAKRDSYIFAEKPFSVDLKWLGNVLPLNENSFLCTLLY